MAEFFDSNDKGCSAGGDIVIEVVVVQIHIVVFQAQADWLDIDPLQEHFIGQPDAAFRT